MKVSRINLTGIILVLLAAACGSSRQAQESEAPVAAKFQSQALYIDGSDNDWVKPLPYAIKSENVAYSISNDQQNLYVLLTTASRQEQQKIIEGGMSVWVNTKGDKSNGEAVGIGYPLDERNNRDRNLMEEAQPQRYQKNKPVTLADKRAYALYGFGGDTIIRRFSYGDSNSVGVIMRLDYNKTGDMVYEMSIPLQALYPEHVAGTPYSTHDLAVGIFIEPLPSGSHVAREGGGGGSGFGVGIGGGVGGFGSGVGLGLGVGHEFGIGGGRKPGKTLFDEAQIWQVVKLAGR
jgi:Tfp pilus assembly protein PilZ